MQAVKATTQSQIQLNEPVLSLLRLKDPVIWSISPDSTVYEAIERMAEKGVGALLVLSGGKLEGIVSERDYARKVILKGKHSQETRVRDIMATPDLFVGPQHSVDECMRMMTTHRVRHLPVLEGARLVGIVSIGDLVNWIIMSHVQTIHQLQSYIMGSYPA